MHQLLIYKMDGKAYQELRDLPHRRHRRVLYHITGQGKEQEQRILRFH